VLHSSIYKHDRRNHSDPSCIVVYTMKPGDLVERSGYRDNGRGVVLDLHELDDGIPYVEVYWPDLNERLWYDELELKVISEGR